jgi:hypothetical protein
MGRTQRRGLLTDRGAGRSTENVLFKSKTSCFTFMGRHFSGVKDALFSDKTSCFVRLGRHFSGEKDALFSDKTSCFTFIPGISV